jgi:uncharacterized membrane protein YdbT with pleckstrin-like domain
MSEEKIIFRGSPSQILNVDVFGGCGLAHVALIFLSVSVSDAFVWLLPVAVGIAAWKWLELRCRVYEVTTERVRVSRGVFTRRTDELELYRVKDFTLIEPFFFRLFSLGTIIITTNDPSTPTVNIHAVKRVEELREELRKSVEVCRGRRRKRLEKMG